MKPIIKYCAFTDARKDSIAYRFDFHTPGISHRIIHHPKYGLLIVRNDGKIDRIAIGSFKTMRFMQVDMQQAEMSSLHFERNGDLWITCSDKIVAVNLDQMEYHIFRQSPFKGLGPDIHHIFEDHENITWYCTEIGLSTPAGSDKK